MYNIIIYIQLKTVTSETQMYLKEILQILQNSKNFYNKLTQYKFMKVSLNVIQVRKEQIRNSDPLKKHRCLFR